MGRGVESSNHGSITRVGKLWFGATLTYMVSFVRVSRMQSASRTLGIRTLFISRLISCFNIDDGTGLLQDGIVVLAEIFGPYKLLDL